MKTLIDKAGEESVRKASQILKNGGIVAFPTDTVYGLGAVFTDEKAVAKIFEAKGRDEGKPLSILVSDISQAALLAENITDDGLKLMKAFWPGALTVIFRVRPEVSKLITAGGDTIGIRMPDCRLTCELIDAAGLPLAAPSANLSGKRSSVTANDVKEDLAGRIDMIIDGGACPVGISSTVVDLTGEHFRILREGTITEKMINDCLEGGKND